jgi:hypothetical protein
VDELLPGGYEAYLRVFHPFVPWSAQRGTAVDTRRTWQRLAADANVPYHKQLTWRQLATVLPESNGTRPWAVWDGELEPVLAAALTRTLAAMTGPERPTTNQWLFEEIC